MGSMNVQDPAEQEKVRRRTHDYVEGGGRHGSYVAADYHHKEYPKFMDRTPAPKRVRKQTDEQFQSAFQEWEDAVNASVVNSKAEETVWSKEHSSGWADPANSPQPGDTVDLGDGRKAVVGKKAKAAA